MWWAMTEKGLYGLVIVIWGNVLIIKSVQKNCKTFHSWEAREEGPDKYKEFPAGNYLFKVNYRNTRTRCEICSKLTIKTPGRCQASFWCFYC